MTTYRPTKLKVTSLGINISDKTLHTDFCDINQYLVVGEKYINNSNLYSLIVDDEGIAVNTSLPDRSADKNKYALYVQGDIYTTGSVFASNVQGGGGGIDPNVLSNILAGFITSNTSNIIITDSVFKLAMGETDNIYYPGRMTLGNEITARNNTYSINVVQSADINVNKSQLSLRNLKNAQVRLGVLGDGLLSPSVLNTPSNIPFEVHIGRDQNYFKYAYSNVYRDPNTGVIKTTILNTPNYISTQYWNAAAPPHILVDTVGNVGIHTSACYPITYDYLEHDLVTDEYTQMSKTTPMSLHVEGPLYGKDILINNPVTNEPVNIERFFVKISQEPTYDAATIIPGGFCNGLEGFYFSGPLGVNGYRITNPSTGELYALSVNGDMIVTGESLTVSGDIITEGDIDGRSLSISSNVHFKQDLTVDNDIYVGKNVVLLTGGFYVPVSVNGSTVLEQVIFGISNFTYSNINPYGAGATTPGVFGVGFDPFYDSMYNQLVVNKRNKNIFELELTDHTTSLLRKYAVIGHINPNNSMDGSLIFATGTQVPDTNSDGINRTSTTIPQNMYFYPGGITTYNAYSTLDPNSNIAALTLLQGNRVGINTCLPNVNATLEVNGKLFVSDEFYTKSHVNSNYYPVAHWFSVVQYDPLPGPYSSGNATTNGIMYYEPNASHVGVNTPPSPNYGMIVAGGIKSLDGYYTADDRTIVVWYDSQDYTGGISPPVTDIAKQMFTVQRVGIGITFPQGTLDLASASNELPTRLNIYNTPQHSDASIRLIGSLGEYKIEGLPNTYQMNSSFVPYSGITPSNVGVQINYNPDTRYHQTVIGPKGNVFNYVNNPDKTAILTVDGNATILGNLTVTGQYKTSNATIIINENTVANPLTQLYQDEVFIGGTNVFIKSEGVIEMGYDGTDDINLVRDKNAILKIKNHIDTTVSPLTPYVLLLEGLYNSLIDFKNNQNVEIKVGLEKKTPSSLNSFIVYDINLLKYILKSDKNGNNYFTGFNLDSDDNPSSFIQVKAIDNEVQNMMRLSYIPSSDFSGYSSELDLHKYINSINTHYTWFFHGPDSAYNQKLSIKYATNTGLVTNVDKSGAIEVVSIDNTGKVGIGETQPEYKLDIKGFGQDVTLSLHSTDSSIGPQILMQTGNSSFGQDTVADYAMYTSNGEFNLIQQTLGVAFPLIYTKPNGQVGIRTNTITTDKSATIYGTLNVTDAIYVNNLPIVISSGGANTFTGEYIYLSPNPGTGVIVNNTGLVTSNLFQIYANPTNANAFILDAASGSYNVQMHMRGHTISTSPVYRTEVNQTHYKLSYNPDISTYKIPDNTIGYTTVSDIYPTGTVGEYMIDMNGMFTLYGNTPYVSLNDTMYLTDYNNDLLITSTENIGVGNTNFTPSAFVDIRPDLTNTSNIFNVAKDFTNPSILVTSDGNVGIGTTLPQYQLHIGSSNVYTNNHYGNIIAYIDGSLQIEGNTIINGSLETGNNPVTSSDSNIKKDILRIENALDKIQRIHGYTFTMKQTEQHSTGLIAQEVQEILPEAVQVRSDGYLGLAYGNMIGLVVEAIHDLAKEIKDIKAKLEM